MHRRSEEFQLRVTARFESLRRKSEATRWLALSACGLVALAAAGHVHAEQAASTIPSAGSASGVNLPITFIVTRYVKPGCEARFEAMIDDLFRNGMKIPGNPTAEFLRPPEPGSHAYTTIIRFDRVSDYRQWLASPQRQEWLARAEPLSEGAPQIQERSSMEIWVSPPDEKGQRTPPMYKTIVLNFVALYPVYFVMRWALAPLTAGWEPATAVALRTGIAVVLAGYGVMPTISHTFRDWLLPPERACQDG